MTVYNHYGLKVNFISSETKACKDHFHMQQFSGVTDYLRKQCVC